MLDESEEQSLKATDGKAATHAVVPCGCGSIAQAVTEHCKRSRPDHKGTTVLTAEPTVATCLKTSIEKGEMTIVPTGDTIMCGMNCGTLSTTAWPALKAGVDACVTVSDVESHNAILELNELGIKVGPCGASTLAALKKACQEERERLGLGEDSVVVLYCTEGQREYKTPV